MKEPAHGQIEVYWQGKALVVIPSKVFNMQGIKDARIKVQHLIESRPHHKWARIYIFADSATAGPASGIDEIVKGLRYSMDKGCQLLAVVGGNVLNKEGITVACDTLNLPYFFFDSVDEAVAFVDQSEML